MRESTSSMDDDVDLPESQPSSSPSTLPSPSLPSSSSSPALSSSTAPASSARLMIAKLVLENFKSYAGSREVGPFHKSFSSIVGPNGSGKSNVIDALLFVFGYRATQIRLKKLSELIHRSSTHPGLTHCSVSVHFHCITDLPGDAYAVVPGSAFVLTRTANRANDSTYFLDQARVPYASVAALLKGHGIDLDHNRFLILQGEVEQIAMMQPRGAEGRTGMLEYLEDIIGSSRYVADIDALEKELDTVSEERTDKVNRLKLTEKEKDALEGPKDEALAFLTQQRAVNELKAQLMQHAHYEAFTEGARVYAERSALAAQLATEKAATEAAEVRLHALEAEHAAAQREHADTLRELDKCKADFASAERKDVKYKEDIKNRRAKLKKAAAKLAKLKAEAEDVERIKGEEEARLPGMRQRIGEVKREKEAAEAEVERLYERMKTVVAPIKAELEAKQKQLIPHRAHVNGAQHSLDEVTNQIKVLEEKSAAADTQQTQLRQQAEALTHSEGQAKLRLDEARTELAAHTATLTTLSSALKALQERETSLQGRHTALVKEVEENRASLASSPTSTSMVLSSLLSAQSAGKLSGIIGRLGDLGIIPGRYDAAVTTACSALNDIVVDSEASAGHAIAHLKRHQLGRARFILLDKVAREAKEMEAPWTAVAGAERLFDLVEVREERVRAAFWFALKNTLVCSGMDEAMKVGYEKGKRRRVVTLDGKLIEATGTMSGGGQTVARGGMRSAWGNKRTAEAAAAPPVTEAELKAMDADIKSVERQLADILPLRKEKLEQQKEATKARDAAEAKVQKAERQMEEIRAQLTGISGRVEALTASPTLTAAEVRGMEGLRKQRTGLEAALEKAKARCRSFEEEVAVVERRIMEQGGQAMKDRQAALQALVAEHEELTTQLSRFDVTQAGHAKALKRLTKDVGDVEDEHAKLEAELVRLQEAKATLEDDAMAVLQLFNAAQQLVREKEDGTAGVQAQLKAEQAKVDATRDRALDVEMAIEEKEALRRDCDVKEKSTRRRLRDLIATMHKERLEWDELNPTDPAKPDESKDESKETAPARPVEVVEAVKPRGRKRGKASAAAAATAVDAPFESEVTDEEVASFGLLPVASLSGVDRSSLTRALTVAETRLASLKPNMRAIADFRRKLAEYTTRADDLARINAARDALRTRYDELRKARLSAFMAGFTTISTKLKEMYQMLTLGGDAELELVDSLDPFTEGVLFSVRPPKKSWKSVSNLSGGEKTLSSLSLVFALHHYRPAPLYVMDEIDAALDFRNVSIVGNYIKERTRDSAQFIIISLRNNMFERADRLVGIYKVDDQTRSITIDPTQFVVQGGDNAERDAREKENAQMEAAGKGEKGKSTVAVNRAPLATIN